MLFSRLQKSKDYRVFRDFTWPASLPNFARFNLIYGWNGAGKTSLSDLFRQMQRRQVLSEGTVEVVIGETRVLGTNFDTATLPQLRVFNRDTVDRSVFELGGKHLPPVFFIGEDSVEKQRKIEELKKQLEKQTAAALRCDRKRAEAESLLDTLCTEEAKGVKNLLTVAGGGPYNNYNAANFRAAAQQLARNAAPTEALSAVEKQKHLAIKDGKPLPKVAQPSVSFPDLIALVERTQKTLGRSVTSTVINALAEDPELARWVSAGLGLHTGSHSSVSCHFCSQPLVPDRVQQLQAHFNDEFNRFQIEVGNLMAEVERAKGFTKTIDLPAKESLYENLRPGYEKAVNSLHSQALTVDTSLDVLLRALSSKRDEPFRSLELRTFITNFKPPEDAPGRIESFFQAIFAGLAGLTAAMGQTAFEQARSFIAQHNERTEKFDTALKEARTALAQDEVLKSLPQWRSRLENVAKWRAEQTTLREENEKLKNEITVLERQIRQHQRPAEELNDEIAAYLGRGDLKFSIEQNGYRVTRGIQPAVHLSEGERTAIAFLYFLKSLQGTDFDLKNGIVVIDDPVSSLDSNSLFSAFSFMKDRTFEAAQLFILTHNFAFFRQVRNWFHHLPGQRKPRIEQRPARFYMIAAEMRNGVRQAALEELDQFLYEYESEYHYLFKRIHAEVLRGGKGGLEAHYSLPNIARRLLESFLAFRVPDRPGELFQKLEAVSYDAAAKTRILRFLHTYSHFDQVADPGHDISVLSETVAVLTDVLELMKSCDRNHYEAMVQLVSPRKEPDVA